MRLNEHLAQTGRTHRLIQKAEELAKQGRRVFILCATQEMANVLQERRIGPHGRIKAIKLPSDFNWETMLPRSAEPGAIYMPDHTTAEQEILRLQAKIAHFQLLQMQIYPMTL